MTKSRRTLGRRVQTAVVLIVQQHLALGSLPVETLWGLSINMTDLTATIQRKDGAAAAKPLADF